MSSYKLRKLFKGDFTTNLIQYLRDRVIDESVYNNYLKKYRFKQDASYFTLENNRLFAHPNDLQGVVLEIILTEGEKRKIIEKAWSNPEFNGFSGTDKLYDKLKYKYLNIGREEVKKVINSLQTRQILQPFKVRVVKPI